MSWFGRESVSPIAIGWAMVGVLGGHVATYALLFPDAHEHDAALAASGHSWLDLLGPLVLAGAAVAILAGLLSRWSHGGPRSVRFSALAVMQVALFAGLEVSERLASGLTLVGLPHELAGHGLAAILIVGTLIQIIMAWLGTRASLVVRKVAARLRSGAEHGVPASPIVLIDLPSIPRLRAASIDAIRGPPLVA
jgi:uncharacterized protein YbjT (DUF2867 family)